MRVESSLMLDFVEDTDIASSRYFMRIESNFVANYHMKALTARVAYRMQVDERGNDIDG